MAGANGTVEDDDMILNQGVVWTLVVVGAVTWTNGVFGNILLLCTLLTQPLIRSRNPGSAHDIFIGNLAVADLFIVGYGLPFWLWDVVYGVHPTVNQAHCKVNAYVGFVCCVTSILILWTISFNRYMSVCHHATYQRLVVTRRRALWFCVALWLGMALVSSIPFYGPGAYGYDRKIRACFVDRLNSDSVSYIFVTVPSVIVLITIGFFNGAIFRYWRQHKKRMSQWRQTTAQKRQQDNESRSAKATNSEGPLSRNCLPPSSAQLPTTANDQEPPKNTDGLGNRTMSTSFSEATGGSNVEEQSLGNNGEKIQTRNDVSSSANTLRTGSVNETPGRDTAERKEGHPSGDNTQRNQSESVNKDNSRIVTETAITPTIAPVQNASAHHVRGKSQSNAQTNSLSDKALVRSLFAVYVCLVVLYATVVFVGLLEVLVDVPAEVSVSSNVCFFLNSSINWLLYGAFNKSFRVGYRRMLTSCRRGNRVGVTS